MSEMEQGIARRGTSTKWRQSKDGRNRERRETERQTERETSWVPQLGSQINTHTHTHTHTHAHNGPLTFVLLTDDKLWELGVLHSQRAAARVDVLPIEVRHARTRHLRVRHFHKGLDNENEERGWTTTIVRV